MSRSALRAVFVPALLLASARAAALSCTVATQPVAFGSYDPLFLLPADGTGQITVDCTTTVSILVSYTLSLSTGGSGQFGERRMSQGASELPYNLYTNVTHATVWGDGSGGSSVVQNTVTVGILGISNLHTVYGRIPAQQNVGPGSYGDTIVVTLDY